MKTSENILSSNRLIYAKKMAANPHFAAERKAAYRKAKAAKRKRMQAASRRHYERNRKEILATLARARQEARELDAMEAQLASIEAKG